MQKLSKILLIAMVLILLFLESYMIYSIYIASKIEINWALVFVLLLLSVILIIANIVVGLIGLNNKRNEKQILSDIRISLLAKVLLIPFFISNFYMWFLFSMAFLIVPGLQIFFTITILGIIWTYGIMLATSSYSIAALISLYRKNKIKLSTTVINVVLQLIFVLDVISYIVFYICNRKKIKEN